MKRPRSRTSKRGYQLTPDAVRILESRPAPFTLTPKGVAFVADCKSKLGAIAENENLPRKDALYRELDGLLAYLPFILLTDDFEFEETLQKIRKIKAEIIAIESK